MCEKLITNTTPGYWYNSEITAAVHLNNFNNHHNFSFSNFDQIETRHDLQCCWEEWEREAGNAAWIWLLHEEAHTYYSGKGRALGTSDWPFIFFFFSFFYYQRFYVNLENISATCTTSFPKWPNLPWLITNTYASLGKNILSPRITTCVLSGYIAEHPIKCTGGLPAHKTCS